MKGSPGRWKLGVVLGALGLLGSRPAPPPDSEPSAVLYFFTTPEAEAGPEGARRARDCVERRPRELRLRTVLLAQDFSLLRTMSEDSPLFRTMKELEKGRKPGSLDIPLYDEEGLRLAELWDVRSVPAFVLVRNGRAHRTAGGAANLELIWECTK